MSNFNLTVMKSACTDEWIAKTYAEYLMHCANNKTKLMDAINDLCADEELEVLMDTAEQNVQEFFESCDQIVINKLKETMSAAERASFDFTTISRDDQNYQNIINQYYDVEAYQELMNNIGVYSVPSFSSFVTNYLSIGQPAAVPARLNSAYSRLIDTKTSQLLSDLEYDDSTVIQLNDGYVKLKSLVPQMVKTTDVDLRYLNGQIDIARYNGDGTQIGYIRTTIEDVWDEFKANLVSTIAWSDAFDCASINGISDRLTSFTTKISTIVSDVSSKFSATISTLKNVLSDVHLNLTSFINEAETLLGWTRIINNDTPVSETSIYAYTGASPMSDIDLNSAKGFFETTGKAIAIVAKAAWDGIKALGTKIWSKIRPYAAAVTTNPYDLACIDDKATSYTVDGWCFTVNSSMLIKVDDLPADSLSAYIEAVNGHKNEWIKVSNIFGEVLFRIKQIQNDTTWTGSDPSYSHTGLGIAYDMQLKPRCMKVSTFTKYLTATGPIQDQYQILPWDFVDDYDFTQWCSMIENFKTCGDMYNDITDPESYCCIGFLLGMYGLVSTINGSCTEMYHQLQSNSISYTSKYITQYDIDVLHYTTADWNNAQPYVQQSGYIPASSGDIDVTNLDFLHVVSGAVDHGAVITFSNMYECVLDNAVWKIKPKYVSGISDLNEWHAPRFILTMLEVWKDKVDNPQDFSYYPYSSDNVLFDDPRFKIKTDQDNANIAEALVNVLVVIGIIAISVVVVGGIVKICKAKRMARLNRSVGTLSNKMWNNQKLTTLEALQFSRKSRKVNKMNASVDGLAAGNGLTGMVKEVGAQIVSTYKGNSALISNRNTNDGKVPLNFAEAPIDTKLNTIRYEISGR